MAVVTRAAPTLTRWTVPGRRSCAASTSNTRSVPETGSRLDPAEAARPAAADRWTWLILACYASLPRRTSPRPAAWQRPAAAHAGSPRVPHIRQTLPLASARTGLRACISHATAGPSPRQGIESNGEASKSECVRRGGNDPRARPPWGMYRARPCRASADARPSGRKPCGARRPDAVRLSPLPWAGRAPPLRRPSAQARPVLRAAIVLPRKDHSQGAPCGRVGDGAPAAPPLTLIFPGKDPGFHRKDGAKRGAGLLARASHYQSLPSTRGGSVVINSKEDYEVLRRRYGYIQSSSRSNEARPKLRSHRDTSKIRGLYVARVSKPSMEICVDRCPGIRLFSKNSRSIE